MKRVIPVLLVSLALLTASCAVRGNVNPNAFGPEKRYAVVSIIAPSHMLGDFGKGRAGYEADDILADAKTIILEELGRSKHFRLVPEKKVIKNQRYKSYPDTGMRGTVKAHFITPKGYKFAPSIRDKAWYANLAKELNVDGTMVISTSYTPGASSTGKVEALTTLSMYAFDREGNVAAAVVVRDGTNKISGTKSGFLSKKVSVQRDALVKEILISTKDAALKLLARLDGALLSAQPQ